MFPNQTKIQPKTGLRLPTTHPLPNGAVVAALVVEADRVDTGQGARQGGLAVGNVADHAQVDRRLDRAYVFDRLMATACVRVMLGWVGVGIGRR